LIGDRQATSAREESDQVSDELSLSILIGGLIASPLTAAALIWLDNRISGRRH
jgi:hypothetical protein